MTAENPAARRVPGVVVRDASWRERRGLSRSDRPGALAVSIPSAGLFVLPAADLRGSIEQPVRIAIDPAGTTSLWLAGYEAYVVTDPSIDGPGLLRLRDQERARTR